SLYLHCDPTASHYLKIVLDGVFGKEMFRSEIIWKRTSAHSSAKRWGPVHDTIFFYARTDANLWTSIYTAYDEEYLRVFFDQTDAAGKRWKRTDLTGAGIRHGETGLPWKGIDITAKGRHWAVPPSELDKLDAKGRVHWPKKEDGMPRLKQYPEDLPGVPLQDLISDIRPMHNMSDERLGYPTQKPLALLERIISASSNEGDVVLDPFCGCGTAVHAAQNLKRKWIGIDITHLAISLIEKRLKSAFRGKAKFEVHGTPKDLEGACNLTERDKYQFQWWAVSLVDAQPFQGKKKGADTGIDGVKFFRDLDRKEVRKIVVSVKGGGIKPDDVRALNHVREREKAEIGLFISLEQPTPAMVKDAASVGFYQSMAGKKFARVQLLTVEALLNGTQRAEHPDYEPDLNFKKARAERDAEQQSLI
ncbi:MAG: restriction endonuclease, partial [Chthoniobacterales bacterium]|nr:restriction endonuclease [Chthoniobacterales bacterium]